MPVRAFEILCTHLQHLLEAEAWEPALLHLRQARQTLTGREEATRLYHICKAVPEAALERVEWAEELAWVAYRADAAELAERAAARHPDELAAFAAWLLVQREAYAEALVQAERALQGRGAAVAWRMRAMARCRLGLPDWREAYLEAAQHMQRHATERDHGLCLLEYGAQLTYAGDNFAARSVYAEAISLLRADPYMLAYAYYNLGIACLRLYELHSAASAFEHALVEAQRPKGQSMLSLAWRGLGSARRARGEFPRALHAYEESLRSATSAHGRIVALRGIGHTQRMAGQLDAALLTFYEALREARHPEQHSVYADIAAAKTQIGDRAGALEAAGRTDTRDHEDAQRLRIVQAELQRQAGNVAEAAELLQGVDLTRLWAFEEARAFPALFALRDYAVPPAEPMRVRVSADGAIRAWVNDVPVSLRPAALEASLLALLLWHGGSVSVERALDALDVPGSNERLRKQALSRAVVALRRALGWKTAVHADGQLLTLDPGVIWSALEVPTPQRAQDFCAGRFDRWVTEWAEVYL
ncbi:tetratricopeptide (TPR) repeat protein [Deinobacterium chartae]|uniref:Tetratricopeptide (TPR) repeat protein n=1 Tax=Deinobacterium chartae TaxID=521158 RepID=A0A841I8A3_9DEIO|nr:tetratricopeptide repeat protein [Deinobacterium chartae]MBB6100015.1 tetratricopeptide (TPR) repeat protein [Deinobacterium chartae]